MGSERNVYVHLQKQTIKSMRDNEPAAVVIIRKIYCFVYLPDGSIVCKKHNCSCDHCLIGNFQLCQHEKYLTISSTSDDTIDSSDEDFSSNGELCDEELSGGEDEHLEIRGSCILNAVENESTTALFSATTSPELFYLHKVLAMEIANDDICDIYNYAMKKGEKNM